MYFNNEQREAVEAYLNKSFLKKLLYIGRGMDISDAVVGYVKANYYHNEKSYEKLSNLIWSSNTKHMREAFSGRDFGALKLLLGDVQAENFKAIWDRATLYAYSVGYYRRSYRTNQSSVLYLSKYIGKLKEFIYLEATGFNLDKYLSENVSGYQGVSVIADIIALELDNNNQEVISKVRNLIYNDNNVAILTREVINGVLMSRNQEAHKMIGELLLAAKLQEGLRQSIVEAMDECSREASVYLLKLIIDNSLYRFSSIVRAFGTWSGLAIDTEKPKLIQKCLEAAYGCLTDKEYLDECIASPDNLLIYIGLWATAFDEIEQISPLINKLLGAEEKYRRLVALQFIYETQFPIFRHQATCRVLLDRELEVRSLAIKNLFGDLTAYSLRYQAKSALEAYRKLGDSCYGMPLFNQLKDILDMLPKKEIEFKGSVFPWVDFKLTAAEILEKMLLSIALKPEDEAIDMLIDYKDKMSVDTRGVLVEILLKKPKTYKQRLAIIEFCGDRSAAVRASAFNIANTMDLKKEDYEIIESLLQYKSGDLRKSAIMLLLKQNNADLKACVTRLTQSNNENMRLGAIDIVSAMNSDSKHRAIYVQCLESVNSIDDKTQKEIILTQSISVEREERRTFENGFGLYDDTKEIDIPKIKCPADFNIDAVFKMTSNEIKQIIEDFSSLIHQNRDFEYRAASWGDNVTTVTLGGSGYLQPFDREEKGLQNYPLAEQVKAIGNKIGTIKLIVLDFYLDLIYRIKHEAYMNWYDDLMDSAFNIKVFKACLKDIEKIPYFDKATRYISLLVDEIPASERFELSIAILQYLFASISEDKHTKKYMKREEIFHYVNEERHIAESNEIRYWLSLANKSCGDDESFKKYFYAAYSFYKASKYTTTAGLGLEEFGRALKLGLSDANEIYKELLARPHSVGNMRAFTGGHKHGSKSIAEYADLVRIGNEAVDMVANIEVARGELNTQVSNLAAAIQKCFGTGIFTAILLGSEKDTYVRGYNFVGGDCTKKEIFSHMLKCCYPKEGEDAEILREYLKGKKITSRQLIEAAMYAPQWLDIVSDYLGTEGLTSACWYFHAHVNDYFSEEKAAMVARYTPISPQDLKDGAFDQKWFMEAYNTIGDKNFKLVYDSAKYIAGGGLHKRSQLFADATLGRLDIEEVRSRIADKRNKDYMLVYGLVPIKDKDDLVSRYEYIHQFIKESKQFGAQRQASEGRSASIALLNLARNAGYTDVNRLSWNMETAKLDAISAYLVPHKLEDIEVQLRIDELGQADILCLKGDKELRDIPSKYKKDEYIIELKAIRKSLREQYSRARRSFESAMESAEAFKVEELDNLCRNPVLSPIIRNLVFSADDRLGYFESGALVDYNGQKHQLNPEASAIIAHPVHLYESGNWSNYQRDIFERKLIQPFKQVFRELYLPNSDELNEPTQTRRYAGHQVQPRKTLALLKTRGWIASYEEGLQKVYYNENIVANIYAMADWFSPAEVESPTLEGIYFEDRKTFKTVPLDKIPKLIFSETMRDVDLVVSVAHAGGVDPEASLSTIGIRKVIVEELVRLLKLDNVKLQENHAFITGSYGEYTVHLGSGVVHKMAAGAVSILPVHSSHRGRLFLPFIDEDPRSAEIMSKIVLLAEYKKIKDPSILEQIRG